MTSCDRGVLNTCILVVALFLSHALSGGVSFSFGAYYATFLEVFGASFATTSWVGSINMGLLCFSGPLASYMIDKFGVRITVLVGGLLSSFGILLGAFSTSLLWLFLSYGVVAGVGFGLVFTSAVVVIGISLTRFRTLSMGLAISGIGFGNFAYPFIVIQLMSTYGWRGALLITSGLTLNICLFAMFIYSDPARYGQSAEGKELEENVVGPKEEHKASHSLLHNEIPVLKTRTEHLKVDNNSLHNSCVSLPAIEKKRNEPVMSGSFLNLKVTSKQITHLKTDLDRARSTELLYSTMGRSSSFRSISNIVPSSCSVQSFGRASKRRTASQELLATDLYKSSRKNDSTCLINNQDKCVENGVIKSSQAPESEKVIVVNTQETLSGMTEKHRTENLWRHKLKSFSLYSYWLLHGNVVLFTLSLSVVVTHASAYAQYLGIPREKSDLLISLNGIGNVVGRIVLGAVTQLPPVNTFWLYAACYGLAGVFVLVMTVWTHMVGLAVCISAFGFFSAAYGPVLAEATLEVVGVDHFNYGYGFLMISMGLGVTLGAPLAGWLYDSSLDYTSSFYFGGCCLLVSALLVSPLAVSSTLIRRSKSNSDTHTKEDRPS